MKKLILLSIVVCFSFIGCLKNLILNTELTIQNDKFLGAKTAKLELRTPSDEILKVAGYTFPKFIVTTNFYREIKDGKASPTKVNIIMEVDATRQGIKNKAYFLVDDKTFPVDINNITVEKNTSISSSASSSSDGKVNTSTSSRTYKICKGDIILPDSLGKAITEKSTLSIRLYADDDAATATIEPSRMKKVYEFFSLK